MMMMKHIWFTGGFSPQTAGGANYNAPKPVRVVFNAAHPITLRYGPFKRESIITYPT